MINNVSDQVFYHGTSYDFEQFDIDCFGQATKELSNAKPHGDYVGKAIFFHSMKFKAKAYIRASIGSLFAVKVDIKNPLVVNVDNQDYSAWKNVEIPESEVETFRLLSANEPDELNYAKYLYALLNFSEVEKRSYILEQGYDGLVDHDYGQVAVFFEKQIQIISKTKTYS
ncbi:hypothetical protein [Vibrio crassostreae]|uniref:ADP-ribosyltransferase-containing protein n=1 Tax=Vibrio crassostreae TaxID=246167 RepID=UPI001B30CBD6|nr:hypothetical protein [Vibrio crassostreae]